MGRQAWHAYDILYGLCLVLGLATKNKTKKQDKHFHSNIQKYCICHRWKVSSFVVTHSSWSGMREPSDMRHVSVAEQRCRTGLYWWLYWICGSWEQHVLSLSDRQTAKAALLCVDFGLGCSAAFNEVSTSDSIKLLTVTEYSNASAQLGADRS